MDALHQQVRRARRRLRWQRWIEVLAWSESVALLLSLAPVVAGKFWPLGVALWVWPAAAAGLGMAAAVVWVLAAGPAALDAAMEIDRRFELKERVSSALSLDPTQRQSGPGQSLWEDAARRAAHLDLGARFPVRPRRQLLVPLLPAAAVLAVAVFVQPSKSDPATTAQAETVSSQQQIKKASEELVRRLAETRKDADKQGLEDSRELLKRIEAGSKELLHQSSRKEALVKLHDLARQLEERRAQLGGAEAVKQQLAQLKNLPKGPADKFAQAVGRGDLKQAMQELEKLKDELAQSKLDPAKREELARQLEKMEQKLRDAAAAHRAAQEDLKRQIAKANQAGQAAEADRLQQQLDKLQMQGQQMQQLDKLAQKLGQCAKCARQGDVKGAQQAMQAAQAGLGEMQQQLDEMETLDAAMAQLDEARRQMTCPKCGGAGCDACQGGDQQRLGMNAGGKGKGQASGARPENKSDTAFYDSHVKQQVGKGTSIAVGQAGGPNTKGNVFQEIQQTSEAARHGAVDPLTDRRMPRDQREHAREYFDRLREGKSGGRI